MTILKRIFDFYIEGSIHVALSCYALVRMTQHMFSIRYDWPVALFVFFGTVVGYNFVKYDALARTGQLPLRKELKAIIALSVLASIGVCYCFFKLQLAAQICSVLVLGITTLYTLPFFPNRKNARNWKGVKIYMVALCWTGATVVLPVLESGISITSDFWLKCIQRFLLIFILILVFEIIDLKTDDPNLQTVPQKIGVKPTKWLGWLLLLLFYALEFLKIRLDSAQLIVNALMILLIGLSLYFAHENRKKYYTSFWAESIPIVWWLLVLLMG